MHNSFNYPICLKIRLLILIFLFYILKNYLLIFPFLVIYEASNVCLSASLYFYRCFMDSLFVLVRLLTLLYIFIEVRSGQPRFQNFLFPPASSSHLPIINSNEYIYTYAYMRRHEQNWHQGLETQEWLNLEQVHIISKSTNCIHINKLSFKLIPNVHPMVLILDGIPEHFAHAWRKKVFSAKKNPIYVCFQSYQMPYAYQITEIAHYVRSYF